jgi:hypothetical protein
MARPGRMGDNIRAVYELGSLSMKEDQVMSYVLQNYFQPLDNATWCQSRTRHPYRNAGRPRCATIIYHLVRHMWVLVQFSQGGSRAKRIRRTFGKSSARRSNWHSLDQLEVSPWLQSRGRHHQAIDEFSKL